MLLTPDKAEGLDFDAAADLVDGYSGSDIRLVCK